MGNASESVHDPIDHIIAWTNVTPPQELAEHLEPYRMGSSVPLYMLAQCAVMTTINGCTRTMFESGSWLASEYSEDSELPETDGMWRSVHVKECYPLGTTMLREAMRSTYQDALDEQVYPTIRHMLRLRYPHLKADEKQRFNEVARLLPQLYLPDNFEHMGVWFPKTQVEGPL